MHDTTRFGALKKEIPGMTNTILTSALRALEADGIVHREQFNVIPPHVEYPFTKKEKDLLPIFYQMMIRGFKHGED